MSAKRGVLTNSSPLPSPSDPGSGWSGGDVAFGGWVGLEGRGEQLPAISNSMPSAAHIHPGFRYVRKTEFRSLMCTNKRNSVFYVYEKRNSRFRCARKTEFRFSMCPPKRSYGCHRARITDFRFRCSETRNVRNMEMCVKRFGVLL